MINIAIIDDDKTFCDDFKEQIKKIDNSYNTDCYYDINTFLESVSSYNIAIIDIMLGKDNGIDVLKKVLLNRYKYNFYIRVFFCDC